MGPIRMHSPKVIKLEFYMHEALFSLFPSTLPPFESQPNGKGRRNLSLGPGLKETSELRVSNSNAMNESEGSGPQLLVNSRNSTYSISQKRRPEAT